MLCPCNPLGWPTVQVSFSLKSSPLKSQVAGSTGHPDKCTLWGALGRVGRRHPSCQLCRAEVLPGVPCLLFTWEFPRSVGNKDQSGNAAQTHHSVDTTRAPILGCSHNAILSPSNPTCLKGADLVFLPSCMAQYHPRMKNSHRTLYA